MEAFFKAIDQKIDFFYPKTRLFIMLTACMVVSLPLPYLVIQVLSLMLILSIGLMHGATDHYLYMNAKGLSTRNSIPKTFFVKYLVTLAIMALAWWIAPTLAFAVFIITSAYHFGQTQWQYLNLSEGSLLKKGIYTIWGLLILSLIVIINAKESDALIQSVLSDDFTVSSLSPVIYILGAVMLFSLVWLHKKAPTTTFVFESLELAVIGYVSWQGNLLVSFALFFGLWHALRASQVQIDKLKKDEDFNWRSFLLGSLPFTLISLVGIAGLLWTSITFDQQIKPEMLFLIAISVLTMPHMVIYEEFYSHHDQKRS